MNGAFELEICQGKYRYRYEAGKQEVWRNGEPWEAMNGRLIGDKFVFSLAIELDEAIKERDALRSELSKQQALTDAAQHIAEVAQSRANQLQAKIIEMEQQEPVAWMWEFDDGDGAAFSTQEPTASIQDGVRYVPLYALPGAQNVPEKLCYDSRWEISIDYVDGWNAAVDMMRGKSPSWHCPDCCIAFPFGAPKSCPNDDARCNKLIAAAPEAKP